MKSLSHSKLVCFEHCPLAFKLRYIDKVESGSGPSVEAFLGTVVHSALEKLYKDLRFSKLNTLDELLSWYRDQWKRQWSDDILIVRKDYSQENYRKMGEAYIRDYYKRYSPFGQARTIALEEKVTIRLDEEGRHRLRGVIDRLAYAGDGVYEVHDYKTSFSIPVKQYLDDDRQLALYALSVMHNYHDAKRVRLVWHFLSVDKEVVIEKTEQEFEKLKKDTIGIMERIKEEKEFSPKPGPLCSWCEFRAECPVQKHIARTESLPANEYLKEPGVKLVNRYAELKQKESEFKEELGSELAKVQEALFRYAEKEALQVVAGSDVKARIWSRECIKFPSKKEPGRDELEEIVKSAGYWQDASMLDTWELERLVEKGLLPQDVIKRLARFARKQRVERIFLSRLDSTGS